MYINKTLIRDLLVDDATVQGLFHASVGTLTASCHVNMEDMFASASYPQVLIGYGAGETTPGMDADQARIYLTIECMGSGSTTPYKQLGYFRSSIIRLIDDQPLSATAVFYHCRKFSEIEGYDDLRKVHWLRLAFNAEARQNTTKP